MQFLVPQYIQVKERIIGPLTLIQFLWIGGAIGLAILLFPFLYLGLWLFLATIIVSTAAALSLIEINGKPLFKIAGYALKYYWNPQVYLWKREISEEEFVLPEVKIKKIKKELKKQTALIHLREKILIQQSIPIRIKKPKPVYQVYRKITGEREVARRVDYP